MASGKIMTGFHHIPAYAVNGVEIVDGETMQFGPLVVVQLRLNVIDSSIIQQSRELVTGLPHPYSVEENAVVYLLNSKEPETKIMVSNQGALRVINAATIPDGVFVITGAYLTGQL